jgi:hypothetical protein
MEFTRTFGIYSISNRVDLALFSNGYTMYNPAKWQDKEMYALSLKSICHATDGEAHYTYTSNIRRLPRSVLKLDSYDSGKFRRWKLGITDDWYLSR